MTKYQNIFEILREEITSEKIKPHTYLPSENALMKQFEASRDTVRKALNLLLQNGYIQKEKGKGSLVLDIKTINFPVSGVMSFKELQENMPGEVVTYVHEFSYQRVDEEMKKKLFMEDGYIYKVVRIRQIDHEKIILDTDYLNAAIVPNLTEEKAHGSLYEYIENDLGLKISFARKEITVIPASEGEKKLLDMKDHDLLVCIKSYTYLDDATLFQYTESKHRPDKFRFVDFARRSK